MLSNVEAGALKWETESGAGWVRMFSGHLCFDPWNPLWLVCKQEPCFCHSKDTGVEPYPQLCWLVFLEEVNIRLSDVMFDICCVFPQRDMEHFISNVLNLKGKQTQRE